MMPPGVRTRPSCTAFLAHRDIAPVLRRLSSAAWALEYVKRVDGGFGNIGATIILDTGHSPSPVRTPPYLQAGARSARRWKGKKAAWKGETGRSHTGIAPQKAAEDGRSVASP